MNICFYTSEQPTVASLLNMHYLISQRPDNNYTFLKIKSRPKPSPGLVDRLKKIYGEWRFDDGRFDFGRDLALLDKKLKKQVHHIDHGQFRTGYASAVNDEQSEQFLDETRPDLIIQAGAGILKQNIFGRATTINIHHGIAPEIRGIESTFWCMYYGLKDKIGVTCHLIDETLDTGAIVAQQALAIEATSFTDIQYDNIMLGREVLLQGVDLLHKGGYRVRSVGEVPSYYFGWPPSTLYFGLKKGNFQPVRSISEKKFKMKEKRFLE